MASDVHIPSRNNAFEGERRVTLSKEGELRIAGAKTETRLAVHDIGLIELSAESSLAFDLAYTCQIYRKRAWLPVLTLKSKRYRGPDDFADQRGEYRQFIAALHAQVVTNAWPIKTQIAARPAALMAGFWSYGHWALLIWIGAFFAALFCLASFEHPWQARIPELSFALASVAALAYLASKIAGIRAAFGPWPYDPAQIPAALLPKPLGMD